MDRELDETGWRDGWPTRELPTTEHGVKIPDTDAAHSQLGTRSGRRGEYRQAREWDENGTEVRDIDFTDHGRPDKHANPHQHIYRENESGGSRIRGGPEPL
jgi:hypothetical protein